MIMTTVIELFTDLAKKIAQDKVGDVYPVGFTISQSGKFILKYNTSHWVTFESIEELVEMVRVYLKSS